MGLKVLLVPTWLCLNLFLFRDFWFDGQVTSCFREAFYKLRMLRQRQELEQLVEERRKLLAIQDQLQRLHDQLPAVCAPNVSIRELELFQTSAEKGRNGKLIGAS